MATKSKDLDKPPDENNNLQRLSQSLGMSLEDVKTMMSSAGGALPGAANATMKTSAFSGTPPIPVTDDIISNRGRKRSNLTKPGGKSPLWTHFTRGAKMPGNNNYYRAVRVQFHHINQKSLNTFLNALAVLQLLLSEY